MNFFKPPKTSSELQVLAEVRSPYNHIYVIEVGGRRELWFRGDGSFFLQSRVDIEERRTLALVYSKMLMASLLFHPSPRRILMIGLGGGAVTNGLHQWYPEAHIDVVDVDRKVIEVCKKYFFLKETDRYRVHETDGRLFVQNRKGKEPYDLIYLDAFKSGSIPYHLKTRQFYEELRAVLQPEGMVGSNLYGKSNKLKPNDCNTFGALFRNTYCFEDPEQIATVLLATNQEPAWTREDLSRAAEKFTAPVPFLMKEVVSMYRPGKFIDKRASIFKDDFRPEDFLKAMEKHNLEGTLFRPYPIKSTHVD